MTYHIASLFNKSQSNFDNLSGEFDDPDSKQVMDEQRHSLIYQFNTSQMIDSKLTLTFSDIYRKNDNLANIESPDFTDTTFKSKTYSVDLNSSVSLGSEKQLVFGADFTKELGVSSGRTFKCL